jgi:hypothetical protein
VEGKKQVQKVCKQATLFSLLKKCSEIDEITGSESIGLKTWVNAAVGFDI